MWVLASIAGMLCQSFRSACQKTLNQRLSADIVNWTRYAFGLPWIAVAVGLHHAAIPTLPPPLFSILHSGGLYTNYWHTIACFIDGQAIFFGHYLCQHTNHSNGSTGAYILPGAHCLGQLCSD